MEIKKYKNIYIISQDDLNPIIGKLLSDYPKIIHYNNSTEIIENQPVNINKTKKAQRPQI